MICVNTILEIGITAETYNTQKHNKSHLMSKYKSQSNDEDNNSHFQSKINT